MKTITVLLILVSVLASAHFFFVGLTKPESMVVYSSANVPTWGIRASAVLLGAGGVLLLFPATFRLGTILMMMHSLFTVACYMIARDLRGGSIEALLLLIPVFLFRARYPVSVLEKVRTLLGQ